MSSTVTKSKTSKLESLASTEITRILALLALVCFVGAVGAAAWNHANHVDQITYLHWGEVPGSAPSSWFFLSYFYYFLLHATFIPVSLYVSMAVARSLQVPHAALCPAPATPLWPPQTPLRPVTFSSLPHPLVRRTVDPTTHRRTS